MSYHEALWSLSSVPPPSPLPLPSRTADISRSPGRTWRSFYLSTALDSITHPRRSYHQPRDRDRWHSPTSEGIYSLSFSLPLSMSIYANPVLRLVTEPLAAIQFALFVCDHFKLRQHSLFFLAFSCLHAPGDLIIGPTSGRRLL